jgi:hypothetical protein
MSQHSESMARQGYTAGQEAYEEYRSRNERWVGVVGGPSLSRRPTNPFTPLDLRHEGWRKGWANAARKVGDFGPISPFIYRR